MKNTTNNDVLIRFAKYGKWESLKTHVEFKNQPELIERCLELYPNKDFMAIRVNGVESTIKR